MDTIETPSGKGSGDENFPVGSRLIAPALRPAVAAFYGFARAADDIADNGALDAAEKIRRLDQMEAALTGAMPAADAQAAGMPSAPRLAASLAHTGVTDRHARDLLVAFRQDATQTRYRDWEDLMSYCAFSANPVGRFLLDLHGEAPAGYPASDALCSLLQVLNHLQDCAEDYRQLDRVYLPEPWLIQAGGRVEDLAQPAASAPVRQVIDRCLDHCQELMRQARPLSRQLKDWRLAAESEAILSLAHRLMALLSRHDPVAQRVKARKSHFAQAALRGLWLVLTRASVPPTRSAQSTP